MPNEKSFQTFNAVKQQITQLVADDNKNIIELSKQEVIKNPEITPSAPATPTDSGSDSGDAGNNDDDFGMGDDLAVIDDQDGPDKDLDKPSDKPSDKKTDTDDSDKDEDEVSNSDESFSFKFDQILQDKDIKSSLEIINLIDKLDIGFEQMGLLSNCFDSDGDLCVTQESFSVLKNQQWVTGHQLLTQTNIPKTSSEIYYASESLKETLSDIVNWIIEKLKNLVEWVYETVTMLNRTFSIDSMYDRFKTSNTTIVKIDEYAKLLPEYDRLKSALKDLSIQKSKEHEVISKLNQACSANPELKTLFDTIVNSLENINKQVKRYEQLKDSLELSTTVDITPVNGILDLDKINNYLDLFKVLKVAGHKAYTLVNIGNIYTEQYTALHSNKNAIANIMLNNHTKDFGKYLSDITTLFDKILGRLDNDNKDAITHLSNDGQFTQKQTTSQTYTNAILTTTSYTIKYYGQITIEATHVDYSQNDLNKLEDVVCTHVESTLINEFKSSVGSLFSAYRDALKSQGYFKCYVANKNVIPQPFTAYKDVASAQSFLNAYKEPFHDMHSGKYDEVISYSKTQLNQLSKLMNTAAQDQKATKAQTEILVRKDIDALSIFSDKAQGAYISLQDHTKKLILRSFLQTNSYMTIRPLANATLCFKNANYLLTKNAELFAILYRPLEKLKNNLDYFIKIAGVINKNSYQIKLAAQSLKDKGIDTQYFIDISNDNIRKWSIVISHAVSVKRSM